MPKQKTPTTGEEVEVASAEQPAGLPQTVNANRVSETIEGLRKRRDDADRELRAAEVEADREARTKLVEANKADPQLEGLAMNGQRAVNAQAGVYDAEDLNEASKQREITPPPATPAPVPVVSG